MRSRASRLCPVNTRFDYRQACETGGKVIYADEYVVDSMNNKIVVANSDHHVLFYAQ